VEASTGLKIRKAVTDDALAIHQIFTSSIYGIGEGIYSRPQKQAWAEAVIADSWSTRILELHFYVAESETKVAGFISWFEGEIVHVYVDANFSGQGIGHQMMEYALSHLKDRNVTLTSSLNALTFYEKFGFESEERIEKERGGVLIPCIRMRRPLVSH
jgi:GNAT superfamily N-acetyltransferase